MGTSDSKIIGKSTPLIAKRESTDSSDLKFSGHETFPCRYAWLPKAANEVVKNPALFANDDNAMVALGVGKNMVRSVRFWAEASRIIMINKKDGYEVTPFGKSLLLSNGRKAPYDPFIEDIKTLWLIHWNLAINPFFRIFAWDFFLNRWHEPELSASACFSVLRRSVLRKGKPASDAILHQQFEIFLHSYVPTRGRKGEVREDNLDCPLVELGLLHQIGIRQSSIIKDKHEPVYAFRREEKNEISPTLFAYCLDDFWRVWHPEEKTLSVSLIINGHYSPGQVFKLPEADLRARCETIAADSGGYFAFQESALQPMVVRNHVQSRPFPLSVVYAEDAGL